MRNASLINNNKKGSVILMQTAPSNFSQHYNINTRLYQTESYLLLIYNDEGTKTTAVNIFVNP